MGGGEDVNTTTTSTFTTTRIQSPNSFFYQNTNKKTSALPARTQMYIQNKKKSSHTRTMNLKPSSGPLKSFNQIKILHTTLSTLLLTSHTHTPPLSLTYTLHYTALCRQEQYLRKHPLAAFSLRCITTKKSPHTIQL